MRLQIIQEARLFMYAVALGTFLEVVNKALAFLRRVWHHKTVAVAIEDILFCLMAEVLFVVMVYRENDGRIRGYMVLGIGLGVKIVHDMLKEQL